MYTVYHLSGHSFEVGSSRDNEQRMHNTGLRPNKKDNELPWTSAATTLVTCLNVWTA